MKVVKTFKSLPKSKLARAYGYNTARALVNRVRTRLDRLDESQILQLGEWTGHGYLLPDQVEIICFLLGTPEDPKRVYSTEEIAT